MEYKVQDSQGHSIAKGRSSNPYQVRNLLQQYLDEPYTTPDPNTIHTPTLRIWCSAELPSLLQPTPRVIDHSPPPGPKLSLKILCQRFNEDPARMRRKLRKLRGSQYQRYEMTVEDFNNLRR